LRAIVNREYGSADVLELQEVARPTIEPNEVVVQVRASSANPYDWHLLTGLPYTSRVQFGFFRPKVQCLGADVAGVVEAIGDSVTRFSVGDEVFGAAEHAGAFAEYMPIRDEDLAHKPTGSTFEQAAATPMAALTALQGLRDQARLQPGMHVLINGASGGVGTFAVQIAKYLGAEATGVCSTRNVALVRSIGADHVVDYTREDFTDGGTKYDVILDNVGNRGISACRRALKPKGVYVASFGQPEHRWTGPLLQLGRSLLLSLFVGQKVRVFVSKVTVADLLILKELVEAEKLVAVIDRTYPLEEAGAAMAYLEEGHARGKVVVTI